MKVCFILFSIFAYSYAQTYTNKYDNVNVDEILNNERIYKLYIECLKGQGKCPPPGKEMKRYLPDALATKCAKCSAKQKETANKVLHFVVENDPDNFRALEQLYDPTCEYRKLNEETFKKFEIKIDECK